MLFTSFQILSRGYALVIRGMLAFVVGFRSCSIRFRFIMLFGLLIDFA